MAAAAIQLMRSRFQLLLHVQCFDIKLLYNKSYDLFFHYANFECGYR